MIWLEVGELRRGAELSLMQTEEISDKNWLETNNNISPAGLQLQSVGEMGNLRATGEVSLHDPDRSCQSDIIMISSVILSVNI